MAATSHEVDALFREIFIKRTAEADESGHGTSPVRIVSIVAGERTDGRV